MSLPKYNEEQIASIEEMAAHGFSLKEIAEVITPDDQYGFCLNTYDKNGPVYLAYRKGHLKSQLELRQRIFIDAKHGSSPAQMLAKKILDDAEFKMNHE